MTTTTTPFELKLAGDLVAGLRAFADMIEQHPHIAEYLRYGTLDGLNIPVGHHADPRQAMADMIRAGRSVGGTVAKSYDTRWGNADILLSDGVKLHVYAQREKVCTRVVTGVETVTREVPDPSVEVPMVTVTEQVETVEWVCEPLLAAAGTGVAA